MTEASADQMPDGVRSLVRMRCSCGRTEDTSTMTKIAVSEPDHWPRVHLVCSLCWASSQAATNTDEAAAIRAAAHDTERQTA